MSMINQKSGEPDFLTSGEQTPGKEMHPAPSPETISVKPPLEAQETKPTAEAGPPPRIRMEGARRPRGTAAMDPSTRREVARKGGLAVSRNREHMAEIGRKGGQTVSRNREHMAAIGRKGGEASRGQR